MKRFPVTLPLILLAALAAAVGGHLWRLAEVRQADYRAGLLAVDQRLYGKAHALALRHAESGDPDIDHLLAQVYLSDHPDLSDLERGLHLQRRAAEAGQKRAAFFLGEHLLSQGEASHDEALTWLQKAADCGMPMAHYRLGQLRISTTKGSAPSEQLIQHFRFAAWAGIPNAQVQLVSFFRSFPEKWDDRFWGTIEEEVFFWHFWSFRNNQPQSISNMQTLIENLSVRDTAILSLSFLAIQGAEHLGSLDLFACNYELPDRFIHSDGEWFPQLLHLLPS